MSCVIYTCNNCDKWGSGSDVFDKDPAKTEVCVKCGSSDWSVDWDESNDKDDDIEEIENFSAFGIDVSDAFEERTFY